MSSSVTSFLFSSLRHFPQASLSPDRRTCKCCCCQWCDFMFDFRVQR